MNSLTRTEARKLFDAQLRGALTTGQGASSDEGLNCEMAAALNAVAEAYPNPSDAQVQRAIKAFNDCHENPVDMNAIAERYSASDQP